MSQEQYRKYTKKTASYHIPDRVSQTQPINSEKTSPIFQGIIPEIVHRTQITHDQASNNNDEIGKKTADAYKRRLATEATEYKEFNERLHSIQDKITQLRMKIDKKKQHKKKKESLRHKIREDRKTKLQNKPSGEASSKHLLGGYVSQEKQKMPTYKLGGLVTHQPEPETHSHIKSSHHSPKSTPYYVSSVLKNYKDEESILRAHLRNSIQFLTFFTIITLPPFENRAINLPVKNGYEDKKTLIFDLDETLIHCRDDISQPHQLQLPIIFPTGDKVIAGINIRPYAFKILEELSPDFEIIVFTASHPSYANVVIDYLDPKKKHIHHRLYRQHCYLVPGGGPYVKDLRIINRDLSKMILVDNAAYSYGFQVDNGIPIIPYYEGKEDCELLMLKFYLNKLKTAEDVREINQKTFRLRNYPEYDSDDIDELVSNLYLKSKK